MMIQVIKKLSKHEIEKRGIENWLVWEKDISDFDWYYESEEMCYVLKGKARIKTIYQEVLLEPGDFAIFPAGLRCKWHIEEKFKKHYNIE